MKKDLMDYLPAEEEAGGLPPTEGPPKEKGPDLGQMKLERMAAKVGVDDPAALLAFVKAVCEYHAEPMGEE